MQKEGLRKLALDRRASLTEAERNDKSIRIQTIARSCPQFVTAQTVMVYLHFRNEVKTDEIVQHILQMGKRLIIPFCLESEIIPCLISDISQDVEVSRMGILEPRKDQIRQIDPQEIDFVLVPGVAFDPQGNRLGYGRGYYDRFLPRLREGVSVAGLAFGCQLAAEISSEKHDYKMSLFITENGLIYPT